MPENAESFLWMRNESLALAIAQGVSGRKHAGQFRFLSLEGTDPGLIGRVYDHLADRMLIGESFAVESSQARYHALEARFDRKRCVKPQHAESDEWLEEHEDDLAGRMDMVVDARMLRYVAPEDWTEYVLERLPLLKPAGKYVALVDSSSSELNDLVQLYMRDHNIWKQDPWAGPVMDHDLAPRLVDAGLHYAASYVVTWIDSGSQSIETIADICHCLYGFRRRRLGKLGRPSRLFGDPIAERAAEAMGGLPASHVAHRLCQRHVTQRFRALRAGKN
jgi:hypothetical protein